MTLKVAIHQPNYLPWLGYFYKMYCADVFIFLDDVQFSKGSYINRVRILSSKGPRWLTVPVKVKLGQMISEVKTNSVEWQHSHIDLLRNEYEKTDMFVDIIHELKEKIFANHNCSLTELNINLIKYLATRLGIHTRFVLSSKLTALGKGDDLLVNLVKSIDEKAIYVSGEGGASYQNPVKFYEAGLGFEYTEFKHPLYEQGASKFEKGLSVIDCLLRHGWLVTSNLIKKVPPIYKTP